MKNVFFAVVLLLSSEAAFGQDNTWINPNLRFVLPSGVPGAQWQTGDGYCTALGRVGHGTVLWRTGVGQNSSVAHPKLDPGFYSNALLQWTPSADTARVIDIFNWDGGSYSEFSPLPAFYTDTTPVPRHTYDGLAYVEEQDALYLMLGAYGRGAPAGGEALRLYSLDDTASTWKFTFSDGNWRRIRGNIRRFWSSVYTVSNYESHLRHWPAGRKLLFVNDGGNYHAEFDLQTETWTNISSSALRAPFSLYNARSAWDSKRALWIFRNGKDVCTYDPSARTYARLPDIRSDTALGRGIAYDSRHDAYIAPIQATTATAVFSPGSAAWTEISGSVTLPDAWAAYDSLSDWVCYVNQQNVLKFRYNPATAREVNPYAGLAFPSLEASPNPFCSSVRIRAPFTVSLKVFNTAGKIVASFEGKGEIVWNAGRLPSGLYLLKAVSGGRVYTTRLLLSR